MKSLNVWKILLLIVAVTPLLLGLGACLVAVSPVILAYAIYDRKMKFNERLNRAKPRDLAAEFKASYDRIQKGFDNARAGRNGVGVV